MIRIVIADDHLVVREGLQLILSGEDDFEVVGQATDGAAAVKLAEELKPDLVLMDLRMPGMDGLEAIEHILSHTPDMAIVILTTYNEDGLMIRGLRAGARGFLLKDTKRQVLFDTIRAAIRGETLLNAEILARVMSHTSVVPTTPPVKNATTTDLTERELEVLAAVVRGERNKEIAMALDVTERTIKAHLTHVYNKLGVYSRAEAVAIAIREGLIED